MWRFRARILIGNAGVMIEGNCRCWRE